MGKEFNLNNVFNLLSLSLLFYPVIDAVLKAVAIIDDNPRAAINIVLTGALINIILIVTVVIVVVLFKLVEKHAF